MNSSTGGTDLVSYIAKEYKPTISMSRTIILIDVVIISLNVIFFKEIEIGLYSAIAIYLMGKMIDILFEGIYFTKLLLIVSDKNEEIAKQVGEKIKRGTTRTLWKRNVHKRKKASFNVCSIKRRHCKNQNDCKKNRPQMFHSNNKLKRSSRIRI